jgi:hypothetical protein
MDSIETSLLKNDTFCSETVFQRMLILERKKTERSGRPFLLILLNIDDLLRDNKRPREVIMLEFISSLNESTREIDLKGWYKHDSLIGIICTEVDRGKRDAVVAKIKNKLLAHFGPEELNLTSLYLIDYPEYEAHTKSNSSSHLIEELQPERKGMFYS